MVNARAVLHAAVELQKVALKFQNQMMELLASGEEVKLGERVQKGIEYFNKSLTTSILIPLDEHLGKLKGIKKVGKYLKYVRQLRNAVARKINSIGRAQYGEVIFNPRAVDVALRDASVDRRGGEKSEKGGTLKETLSLLKSGMTPFDISRKRGLALSTIEGHMAQLVKAGELDVADCVAEQKVNMIIEAIREMQADSIQPVKLKLGDEVTYGEIRAVMNHLHYLEKINVGN